MTPRRGVVFSSAVCFAYTLSHTTTLTKPVSSSRAKGRPFAVPGCWRQMTRPAYCIRRPLRGRSPPWPSEAPRHAAPAGLRRGDGIGRCAPGYGNPTGPSERRSTAGNQRAARAHSWEGGRAVPAPLRVPARGPHAAAAPGPSMVPASASVASAPCVQPGSPGEILNRRERGRPSGTPRSCRNPHAPCP